MHREYAAKQTLINEATAGLEAAVTEHNRCQDVLRDIENRISAHISYVEERELRHLSIQELENVAVKAILDGYHDGLAANQGRVVGTLRRVQ
jgi:hypothetical protein